MSDTLEEILDTITQNCFLPLEDDCSKLPDSPGVYVICSSSIEKLPDLMKPLQYQLLNGHPVIYTGIAGRPTSKKKSLRNRDFNNHFNGNARGSTLRKSLGVLMGLRKRQNTGEMETKKYRFIEEDEAFLSNWMKGNLILHFAQHNTPALVEQSIIEYFNPPLNLKDNANEVNSDFRRKLSELRRTLD